MRKIILSILITIFVVNLGKSQTLNVPDNIGTSTKVGKVGIGTNSPETKLEVKDGSIYTHGSLTGQGRVVMQLDGANQYEFYPQEKGLFLYDRTANLYKFSVLNNGNVGIGTTNPTSVLEVYKSSNDLWTTAIKNNGGESKGLLVKNGHYANKNAVIMQLEDWDGNVRMKVLATGNVGIGTTNPGNYKLAVEGKIGAREVVVTTDDWADFVFDTNYDLMSLSELDNYIKANKHLPEIPTTKEVTEQGVAVGEMNAKLLQKIEELTLHVIDINKRVMMLEKENKMLKKENQTLKAN
ncbi:MAG: hypothetical protein MI739_03155 [Bacteroidales bacterium]|nr:hypothetical protein [Bacteroidales bacterium]